MRGMLGSLPPWARSAVLAGGCIALLLGLSILMWLLKPGFLAKICCRRRRRNSENVTGKPKKHSIDEELQLENVTYRSWARGSLYETGGEGDIDRVSHASHRDSTYSSMSDNTDCSSILSYASGVLPNDEDRAQRPATSVGPVGGPLRGPLGGPPSVVLLLQYLGQDGDSSASGRLAITVQEARCLPSRDYGSSPDPAVQLSVTPLRRLCFPFRLPALLRPRAPAGPAPAPGTHARPRHLLRTRTVRHARQPRYNEDFAVEARRSDLKDWVLQVSVVDDCKVRGSSVLCRGQVRLKQLLNATPGEPMKLLVPVAPSPEERAMLLFGLSFLPTAQRLNVSIIKATRLRLDHVVPTPDHFRPYVRATLIHVGSGRRVDSARTDPQEPSANPEFCETLSLKLTPAQLGTLSLVVALCHRLPQDGDGRVPGSRRPRDRVVGAVAIGSRVSNERGREHWRAIEQHPRRVVSIWHTLS